jgi:O-antigen/teichoic acid export membrane protein
MAASPTVTKLHVGKTDVRFSMLLRAITASWIAVVANAGVAFFLTPFVLHHLGDEAFGLWILVTTIVGYYGLFDLGIRASILRYVSRQTALRDSDAVNRVVATAFYFYLGVCAIVIASAFIVAPWLPTFFSINQSLIRPFEMLFVLAGIVQGVTFPLEIFGGSLQAAARYDQVYLLRVASLLLRAILVVVVLRHGGALFAAGAAAILPNLLSYWLQVPLALKALPGLSLRPKWISRTVFREMIRYGSVSFSVAIGERVRDYIYPILIATLLSPAAVTLFSLPMKLLAFPVQGVGTMTEIVNPISSQLEAHNDFSTLRKLIQHSVQGACLVLIPMAVFLFVFGRDLLSVWVGAQYVKAYPILLLLTVGMGTAATQCSVQSMLFGIERHKKLLWFRLAEGAAIAIVGAAALRIWGLVGLALVSSVTLLTTSVILIPRYLCKVLGLSLRTYLTEAYLKPLLLVVPLAGILLGGRSVLFVTGWAGLIVALLATVLTYLVIIALVVCCGLHRGASWLSMGVLQVFEESLMQPGRFWARLALNAERA